METTERLAGAGSPGALELLLTEIAGFLPRSRKRGHQYYAAGRVGPIVLEDGAIHASVRGSLPYDVRWNWQGGAWFPKCTCPVGPQCKHAYALAIAVLADRTAARRPPAPATKRGVLDRLVAAQGWSRVIVLQELLREAPPGRLHDPELVRIVEEPNADLMLWRLANRLHATTGWLPAPLKPYLHRPDLVAREAKLQEAALLGRLQAWTREVRGEPTRSLRAVLRPEAATGGGFLVRVEARVTSRNLKDEPRRHDQLEQIAGEQRRSPGTLASDHEDLLRALLELDDVRHSFLPPAAGTGELLWLLRRFAATPALSWAADLDGGFAERAALSPGMQAEIAPQPVRVVLGCQEEIEAPRLALQCAFPDGTRRDLAGVAYLRGGKSERGLVVADGRVWEVREQPPADVVEGFLRAGGATVSPKNRALLAALAARFPAVSLAVASHTRALPVTPIVAMELGQDDWLSVRAYAATGAWRPGDDDGGTCVFEYTPAAQWREIKVRPGATRLAPVDGASPEIEPAPHAPDGPPAWIEAPDPAAVEPLSRWLASLPLRQQVQMYANAPAADVSLGFRLSPKTGDALADAWEKRPPGVVFWGDERVQRLLGRPRLSRPRIRIEASGIDWFSVSADWEAEGQRLSDADIARLHASRSRMVKLASGWVRREAPSQDEALARALADLGVEPGAPAERVTLWQLARASANSLHALEQAGGDGETSVALAQLRERAASFSGLPRVEPPAGLRATLRPYQREGLDFLAWTSSMGLGAVLADDMGLGKTVQALAWLLHLRRHEPEAGPALVVCPTSVMHNWVREAERFAPDLRVLVLSAGALRHDLRREIPDHHLLVTTYALLRRDLSDWTSIELFAAILDEAQFVKNPDAAVAAAARQLRARHRLALTGTPLENRTLDLWSILAFACPGVLGSRTAFGERFDRADAPPHVRALLAAKLRPVLLRRLKREVAADLPDRIEERLDCELSDGQRRLYLAELGRARSAVRDLAEDDVGLRKSRIQVLALLTKLRQICCHPSLGGGKASLSSGKVDTLFELLEPLLAEGHKVLVYSQFVRFLDIVEREMASRGIALHKLTGKTTRRGEVVAAFAEDARPCVFLLSLKAGGTGLNLTAASYVVLLDPWWNPAVEAQAIDRTHRIGQDRTVIAYRLVARGTVEEKIHELQERKAALVKDVLGEEGFARALTRQDLDFLLAEPDA